VTEVEVRPLAGDDHDALRAFFLRVPEGDRTFFREDVKTRRIEGADRS